VQCDLQGRIEIQENATFPMFSRIILQGKLEISYIKPMGLLDFISSSLGSFID
jgi:hypothetical protein